MELLKRLSAAGVVPVAVLDKADNGVPTSEALLSGGIDVMEIAFRTAAAADAISTVARNCPDILVGAGTVITLDQCKLAVDCGAKFVVTPGYDEEIVSWCVDNGVAITPGCVTPSEIVMALKRGIKILKFFPANVYGGLAAIKALAGPFNGVKFIPTGGVNAQNLAEYISSPYVYAVGGSWVCPKSDIDTGNFDKITALCKEARRSVLGFEVAHVGINCPDAEASMAVCIELKNAFDFEIKEGGGSNFASSGVEVMKTMFRGCNGHIAIRTNKMEAALAEMEKRGFIPDIDPLKSRDSLKAAYLKDEVGGFAVHLLQK